MEWALLEAGAGQAAAARELFSQGAQAGRGSEPHAPLFAAWAAFEEAQGRWGVAVTVQPGALMIWIVSALNSIHARMMKEMTRFVGVQAGAGCEPAAAVRGPAGGQ